MPTIAITGGSGHLGTAIISALVQNSDWKIRAHYHTQRPPIESNSLTWVQGGLTSEVLTELISGADFVIHSAALISITGAQNGKVFETNVKGTQTVLSTAIQQKVKRLIHVSSTHALQEMPADGIFDETRPYKTESDFAYDYSKAKAEQFVLEAVKNNQLDAFIVRPSSMLGPVDLKPSLLGQAILDIAQRKVPAVVRGGYDFVDVRDVANSIINSIEKGQKGETYNLTGQYYPIKELAKIVSDVAGVKAPKMIVPTPLIMMSVPFFQIQSKLAKKSPKFTKESILTLKRGHVNMSNRKAVEVLGHQVRPLHESVKDLLDWKFNQRS